MRKRLTAAMWAAGSLRLLLSMFAAVTCQRLPLSVIVHHNQTAAKVEVAIGDGWHRSLSSEPAVLVDDDGTEITSRDQLEEGQVVVVWSKRSPVRPNDVDSFLERLKRDGVAYMESALNDTASLHQFHDAFQKTFHTLQTQMDTAGVDRRKSFCFREVCSRKPGRMDVQYGANDSSRACRTFKESVMPVVMPLMRAVLGSEAKVHMSGVLVNLPGSEPQNWHRDGEHLYPLQLPAYAYTVVIPLVTIAPDMGPTELKSGSHLWSPENAGSDFDAVENLQSLLPTPRLGAIGVWDFRLLHRGRENTGSRPRAVAYFTIGKAWWQDGGNSFPSASVFT